MSKNTLLVGIPIFILIAGGLFFKMAGAPPSLLVSSLTSSPKYQAREKIVTQLPSSPKQKKEEVKCEAEMEIFAHKRVQDFMRNLLDSESDGHCISQTVKLPKGFGSFEACKKLKANPADTELEEACAQYLTFARAIYVDELTHGMTDYNSMELSLLLNKILAQVGKIGNLTPKELQNWKEMTTAAVKRMPDNLQAVKAHLVTFAAGEQLTKEQFAEGSELQRYINEGLRIDPKDSQLTELLLHGDSLSENGMQKIEEFVQNNPNNSLGHYHLAGQLWRSGDKNGALQELETALKLSPADARIRKTLAEAQKYPADKKHRIFELQLGFQFEDL